MGLGGSGRWSDLMILKVFSSLDDSVILRFFLVMFCLPRNEFTGLQINGDTSPGTLGLFSIQAYLSSQRFNIENVVLCWFCGEEEGLAMNTREALTICYLGWIQVETCTETCLNTCTSRLILFILPYLV